MPTAREEGVWEKEPKSGTVIGCRGGQWERGGRGGEDYFCSSASTISHIRGAVVPLGVICCRLRCGVVALFLLIIDLGVCPGQERSGAWEEGRICTWCAQLVWG